MPKHLSNPFGKLMERQTSDVTSKPEPIPCATLGADITASPKLIIKAEAILPATDRAWSMTVLQELGI
jgi:hypothetical protein